MVKRVAPSGFNRYFKVTPTKVVTQDFPYCGNYHEHTATEVKLAPWMENPSLLPKKPPKPREA